MTGGVLIMAGGTGGHIFPGLAVARALEAQAVPVAWLGSRIDMEADLVPGAGIEFHGIRVERLRGQGTLSLLLAPFRLLRSILQAMRVIRAVAPAAVLSMGGFVAGPGGLAAWLLRRPVVVHEQNRVPGLTNRVLAKLAARVMAGFPDAFTRKDVRVVGNPVRTEISSVPPPPERFANRTGALRLLVLGGSQGARGLNERVPAAIARLPAAARPEVRHQVGARHEATAREAYAAAGVDACVEPFIEDMAAAYGWADLVIARSGALTVAEVAAAGVAAIFVPFPFAVDDHQTRNAEFLAERGAAQVMPERDLDPEVLAAVLVDLDRGRLEAMGSAARAATRPDAAAAAADVCLEVTR
ncbi:MAG: undecaprenyldiphospho-muramoylpentapeptide beta-N-acetylglucosaminyltransferase [Pseudomonadota bacterium]